MSEYEFDGDADEDKVEDDQFEDESDDDPVQEKLDRMMDLFDEIKEIVRRRNTKLFNRWKAGGFIVCDDVHSTYPSIRDVVADLEDL
jgi:hypothetical protein